MASLSFGVLGLLFTTGIGKISVTRNYESISGVPSRRAEE
jgi:hypothetical protein